MSDYTSTEINDAFEKDGYGWGEAKYSSRGTVTLRGETVPFEKIDSYGGEGQGDDLWVVVKVDTQLFKKEGYYASHYGSDWDGDCFEVAPALKTITVFDRV